MLIILSSQLEDYFLPVYSAASFLTYLSEPIAAQDFPRADDSVDKTSALLDSPLAAEILCVSYSLSLVSP